MNNSKVGKVSSLRASKRVPNMATFTASCDGRKDVIEVVVVGSTVSFTRRHGSMSYEIADPMKASTGTWIATITGIAYFSSSWDKSVIKLADELPYWVAAQLKPIKVTTKKTA